MASPFLTDKRTNSEQVERDFLFHETISWTSLTDTNDFDICIFFKKIIGFTSLTASGFYGYRARQCFIDPFIKESLLIFDAIR